MNTAQNGLVSVSGNIVSAECAVSNIRALQGGIEDLESAKQAKVRELSTYRRLVTDDIRKLLMRGYTLKDNLKDELFLVLDTPEVEIERIMAFSEKLEKMEGCELLICHEPAVFHDRAGKQRFYCFGIFSGDRLRVSFNGTTAFASFSMSLPFRRYATWKIPTIDVHDELKTKDTPFRLDNTPMDEYLGLSTSDLIERIRNPMGNGVGKTSFIWFDHDQNTEPRSLVREHVRPQEETLEEIRKFFGKFD